MHMHLFGPVLCLLRTETSEICFPRFDLLRTESRLAVQVGLHGLHGLQVNFGVAGTSASNAHTDPPSQSERDARLRAQRP
jgi:hypothetical protein